MASLFLRSAARSSRSSTPNTSTPSISRVLQSTSRTHGQRSRMLSSTPAVLANSAQPQETAQTTGTKNVFDYHTVEDLQGMHASQILAETGSRADAKMRHFTGRLATTFIREFGLTMPFSQSILGMTTRDINGEVLQTDVYVDRNIRLHTVSFV